MQSMRVSVFKLNGDRIYSFGYSLIIIIISSIIMKLWPSIKLVKDFHSRVADVEEIAINW